MVEAKTAMAPKPSAFKDKDKPTEVRLSNIVAGKGREGWRWNGLLVDGSRRRRGAYEFGTERHG